MSEAISSVEALDALPVGSVIEDRAGDTWTKWSSGWRVTVFPGLVGEDAASVFRFAPLTLRPFPTPPQDATDAGDGATPSSRSAELDFPICMHSDGTNHYAIPGLPIHPTPEFVAAVVKGLTGHTPPQDAPAPEGPPSPSVEHGDERRSNAAPARPAEPSLVALDGIEGRLIEAARKAARTWDIEAPRQAPEWWFEIAAVMELARQMELAR